jgi:hypothetical protein
MQGDGLYVDSTLGMRKGYLGIQYFVCSFHLLPPPWFCLIIYLFRHCCWRLAPSVVMSAAMTKQLSHVARTRDGR